MRVAGLNLIGVRNCYVSQPKNNQVNFKQEPSETPVEKGNALEKFATGLELLKHYDEKTRRCGIDLLREVLEENPELVGRCGRDIMQEVLDEDSEQAAKCGVNYMGVFIDETENEKLRQQAIDILLERASADRNIKVRRRAMFALSQVEEKFDYKTRIKVLDRFLTMYGPHKSSEDRAEIVHSVHDIANSRKAQNELSLGDKLKYQRFLEEVSQKDDNDNIRTIANDYVSEMKKSTKDKVLYVMKDLPAKG